jgi:mono/diheme cytochrome c family protein
LEAKSESSIVMKLLPGMAVAALLIAAPAAFADPQETKDLFAERCGVCHDTGENSAPLTDDMKRLEPAAVVEKMTTGTMAGMAGGLTDQQKRDIAVFLTGKPLPAAKSD